jgi:hypothetical protein
MERVSCMTVRKQLPEDSRRRYFERSSTVAPMQKARRSELSIHYNQFFKQPMLSARCCRLAKILKTHAICMVPLRPQYELPAYCYVLIGHFVINERAKYSMEKMSG